MTINSSNNVKFGWLFGLHDSSNGGYSDSISGLKKQLYSDSTFTSGSGSRLASIRLVNSSLHNWWPTVYTNHTLNLEDFEKEFDLKLSQYILYQQRGKEDNKFKSVVPNLVSNVNHLNYALTWYFLSIALFIVFFLFYMKNHKKYE